MKKTKKSGPIQPNKTNPVVFIPTQEQIDTLARRLMPEIKRFFVDPQIRKDFDDWQEKKNTDN